MDSRKIDNSYKGFPTFNDWKDISINLERWARNIARLKSIKGASQEALDHARKIVRRYAAVETGAIEKLYDVDRGFTWSVACELADLDLLLIDKGEVTHSLIDSQLKAYDYLLDLATGQAEITEAWLRELHTILCEKQDVYLVQTNLGPQQQPLPLGRYKVQSNHVVKGDGEIHAYAPVDLVGAEMNRLLAEMRSESFIHANPAIQAAYSHYCLVVIHPFADGNGRIARALASIFLYRALSIPFLVMSEDRLDYFDKLEQCDKGNYDEFVDFTIERCFNAIDLIELSIRAGKSQPIDSSLDQLSEFYITKGGYSHEQVDIAANNLFTALHSILTKKTDAIKSNTNLTHVGTTLSNKNYKLVNETYRHFVANNGKVIKIQIGSKPPANALVKTELTIHIPKDCDINDDFIIINMANSEKVAARMTEIEPRLKPSLTVKLELFADSIMNSLTESLIKKARAVYRK